MNTEVMGLLQRQEEAWNRGDIKSFLSYYLPTDEVTFVSSSGVAKGYSPLVDRYAREYPSVDAMGKLSLSDLMIHELGSDSAFAVGRFQVVRGSEHVQGIFSLVLSRVNGELKIVLDHTSRT